MLFGGGRALDGNVSIWQMGKGYRTCIVIAKYNNKCRLKMVSGLLGEGWELVVDVRWRIGFAKKF